MAWLLGAALSIAATPSRALDYTWLGQVDTLWFSNNTSVGGVIRSNWQPGLPFNDASTGIVIDGLAGHGSRVQVSFMTFLSPSPGCSGSFICGSVGPRMGSLGLGAGTTLVVGGSSAFGDAPQYANSGARLEWIGTAMGGAGTVTNDAFGALAARLASSGEVICEAAIHAEPPEVAATPITVATATERFTRRTPSSWKRPSPSAP